MALTKEQIESEYRRLLGRGLREGDPTAQRVGAGQTLAQLKQELLNSPERQTYLKGKADVTYKPTLVDIAAQEKSLAQQKKLGELGIKGQEDILGQNLAKQIRKIAESKQRATGSLEERQQQLGLLRSGLTAAGLGDISKQAFESETDIRKQTANELAKLALQRAGLSQSYATGIERLGAQRGQVALSKADLIEKLQLAGEEDLANLMQQEETKKQQLADKKLQIALSLPEGQTVNIPEFGGEIKGLAPTEKSVIEKDTQVVTAGGRQLLVNKQTGETIADLGSAYKGTGGGGGGGSDLTTAITKTQAIKAAQSAVQQGQSPLEVADEVLNLPLSESDTKSIIQWLARTYNINLNSPTGQRILNRFKEKSNEIDFNF